MEAELDRVKELAIVRPSTPAHTHRVANVVGWALDVLNVVSIPRPTRLQHDVHDFAHIEQPRGHQHISKFQQSHSDHIAIT